MVVPSLDNAFSIVPVPLERNHFALPPRRALSLHSHPAVTYIREAAFANGLQLASIVEAVLLV
jgi:hypothetical protein